MTGESLWPRLAQLPLVIEACEYDRLHAMFANEFERVTTQVRLAGAGADGLGEDVSVFRDEGTALHVARAGARGRVDAGELFRAPRRARAVAAPPQRAAGLAEREVERADCRNARQLDPGQARPRAVGGRPSTVLAVLAYLRAADV